MVDVATVSVVSSAVVAVGTIAVNFIGGERQRRHEADLDFEARVWERKSEALFEVIGAARNLLDSDAPVGENPLSYALYLSKMLDALNSTRSTVETLASNRCREELAALIEALHSQGVKEYVGHRSDRYLHKGLEAGVDDVESWRRYSKYRKEAEDEAVADFHLNLADLQTHAARLLEAARESVRRPKD